MTFLIMDFEFTGLYKNTTQIAMGASVITTDAVNFNKHAFYAEFTDYDKSQVDDWIQENVINKLGFDNINEDYVHTVRGTKTEIRDEFLKWIEPFKDTDIEIVLDCGHYDFVLFIDLFGAAFDVPKFLPPTYFDLNELIYENMNHPRLSDAFDMSREELFNDIMDVNPDRCSTTLSAFKTISDDAKHNALWDVCVAEAILLSCIDGTVSNDDTDFEFDINEFNE